MESSSRREKVRLSLTLNEELVIQLRVLAKKDSRSLSNYINYVLLNHINQESNQIQKGSEYHTSK